MALLHIGMAGMTIALPIAGYEQSSWNGPWGGSTWQAYFAGQTQPWFVQAMWWRMAFGVLMTAGLVLLVDFLRAGAQETRPIKSLALPQATATGG